MSGLFKLINHWRIRKWRHFRNFYLSAWYFFKYERKRPKVSLELISSVQSVAVLMLGTGIGDAIVQSGFISELRRSGKKVYCICSKKSYTVFDSMVKSDGLYLLPNKPKRKDAVRFGLNVDVLILFSDPDKNLHRNLMVLTAVKHKYAVGFNQTDERFFDLNIIRSEQGCHWSDRLKKGAQILGVNISHYTYDLHFSTECKNAVQSFITSLQGNRYIIFNPTASDIFRSLSEDSVMQIIKWLAMHTQAVLIVFNVKDDCIINQFPQVIFNPFKELDKSILLISQCSLLITVDTCFVHAGNFFNVPQLCFYNNRLADNRYDNNKLWGPHYGKAHQIFSLDHLNTETGDDLRLLHFESIKPGLELMVRYL